MEEKSVLITGATGFLGSRTVEYLESDQSIRKILATGRIFKNSKSVLSSKIKYLLGDLKDPDFVTSLFQEEITHIVHCAALSSPWGSYKTFYNENVVPMKNLINSSSQNSVKNFVNISTPSLYFDKKDRYNINEEDPLPKSFVNAYATTKREGEILLEKSGLPFISLRPRAIIGRGDRVIMPRLINAVKSNKLRIIGNGENVVDLVSVENVARAIQLSLNAPEMAMNQHYNVTDDNPIKLWEIIESVLKKLNLRSPKRKIPLNLANLYAHLMEWNSKLISKKEPILNSYSVHILALNFTLDISKAKKNLGYLPVTTTKRSIDEFVEWYLNLGYD